MAQDAEKPDLIVGVYRCNRCGEFMLVDLDRWDSRSNTFASNHRHADMFGAGDISFLGRYRLTPTE